MGAFVRFRRRGTGLACAAVLAAALAAGRCATRADSPRDVAGALRTTRPAAARHPAPKALARPRDPDWRTGRVPSVRLEGDVVMGGEPVAGAEVRVGVVPGSIEAPAAVTDERGRFDLGLVEPLDLSVVARLGDRRGIGWIDLGEHVAAGRARLTIDLEPCERWITGRLVDAARRPLAGVVLHERVGRDREVSLEAGRSGADGRFAVCGEALTAAGGSLARVEVHGPDAGDVILAPALTVRGQVIRTDGAPVAGAIVEVTPIQEEWASVTARSDRDGTWSAEVAGGCVAVSASHRGQAAEVNPYGEGRTCGLSPPPTAVCGLPGGTAESPPVVLERCERAARGVVRIAGVPAAGLVVTVGNQRDLTDASGGFSFPCAVGRLEVAGHDLARAPPILEGEDTYLELDATPSPWIRGRVTIAGQPIAGAGVSLAGAGMLKTWFATATARDGSYAIQVSPGSYVIAAQGPGGVATAPPHRAVTLPAGARDVRVDLDMGTPTAVQGSVHTADGTAVAGVPILLYRDRDRTGSYPLALAPTDARGFFQLTPAPGTYLLDVGGGTWQLAGRRDHVRLTVTEDGALDLDITIEPFAVVDDESE